MAENVEGSTGARVLLVEDEVPIRRFLHSALAARGYEVMEAGTLAEARLLCTAKPPEVVLLDLGLPDGDGVQLVREVREWSNLPILVLSARGQEEDKVTALDAGADDYLTKPFGVPELLARLRVALRHARLGGSAEGESRWRWSESDGSGWSLDATRRVVSRTVDDGEHEVRLTPTEYRLLLCLARHHGMVMTHSHLLREVWGPHHEGDVAYLRVYMGQLRQKLEPEPARPRYLLTEPGVGYRMRSATAIDG
jgi:two-component system KDP operon response regulator KdpE